MMHGSSTKAHVQAEYNLSPNTFRQNWAPGGRARVAAKSHLNAKGMNVGIYKCKQLVTQS